LKGFSRELISVSRTTRTVATEQQLAALAAEKMASRLSAMAGLLGAGVGVATAAGQFGLSSLEKGSPAAASTLSKSWDYFQANVGKALTQDAHDLAGMLQQGGKMVGAVGKPIWDITTGAATRQGIAGLLGNLSPANLGLRLAGQKPPPPEKPMIEMPLYQGGVSSLEENYRQMQTQALQSSASPLDTEMKKIQQQQLDELIKLNGKPSNWPFK
jgi:hypothetical protein